jgi:ribonuclease VapC
VIAVDTSALMAIVLNEASAIDCARKLLAESEILISAGSVAEALVVATRRNVVKEMTRLLDGYGFSVAPVTAAAARRVGAAYARWGKGVNPIGVKLAPCRIGDMWFSFSSGMGEAPVHIVGGP